MYNDILHIHITYWHILMDKQIIIYIYIYIYTHTHYNYTYAIHKYTIVWTSRLPACMPRNATTAGACSTTLGDCVCIQQPQSLSPPPALPPPGDSSSSFFFDVLLDHHFLFRDRIRLRCREIQVSHRLGTRVFERAQVRPESRYGVPDQPFAVLPDHRCAHRSRHLHRNKSVYTSRFVRVILAQGPC
jgi:hypothetical protein